MSFPILKVVTGAIVAPLDNIKGIIFTVLTFVGAYLFVIVVVTLFAYLAVDIGTIDTSAMSGDKGVTAQQEALASFFAMFGFSGLLLTLFTVILLGITITMLFNYWVRFGAGGTAKAWHSPLSRAISMGGRNFAKFFLASIAIGIAVMIAIAILGLLGVPGMSFAELTAQSNSTDLGDMMVAQLGVNMVMLLVMCAVYALFSASLTKTALDNPDYEMGDTHVAEFAVVLFIIYLVSTVPVILLGLVAPTWLIVVAQILINIWIIIVIPTAHGLRYNICKAELEEAKAQM